MPACLSLTPVKDEREAQAVVEMAVDATSVQMMLKVSSIHT